METLISGQFTVRAKQLFDSATQQILLIKCSIFTITAVCSAMSQSLCLALAVSD
jgi:hypothetical protein